MNAVEASTRRGASDDVGQLPFARAEHDDGASGRRLRLPDGRLLAYKVYGAPDGRPIYFFHGFPGSHLQAALVHAQAAATGIALVAFDRAGFGHSDPAPQVTVDSVVGDVSDLADALGHRRFGVIGVSCGGPHALACARWMPSRVSAVGLLAGAGPMQRPEARDGQLPVLRLMFGLARWHAWLVSPLLALDWLMFRFGVEHAIKALSSMLTPPDRELLGRNDAVRSAFGASLAAAYRQGIGGALREARRIANFSEAELQGIDVPVHVFQSGHDRHVRPSIGRFIAATLPRGQLHWCPEEGHLSIAVNRFDACARLVLQAH
jgi:pimeloyl-ACP methyl ester carboxylesterase